MMRSRAKSVDFGVMVAVLIDEDAPALAHASPVTLLSINPPEIVFSQAELMQHRKPCKMPTMPKGHYLHTMAAALPEAMFLYDEKHDAILVTVELRDENGSAKHVDEDIRSSVRGIDRNGAGGPRRHRASSLPARATYNDLGDRKQTTSSLLATANQHLLEDLDQAGRAMYRPTEQDIFAELYKVLKEKPEYYGTISLANIEKLFRRHLRFVRRWEISISRLKDIISSPRLCVNVGEIAVTKEHLEQKATVQAMEDANKVEKELKSKKFKRIAKPVAPNLHDGLLNSHQIEQASNTTVCLNMRRDPDTTSTMRLRFQFNYIDDDVKGQPKHLADVFLTHRNARELGDVPPNTGTEPDRYFPTHRLLEVTDPRYRPLLERLWPRAVQREPNYFRGLYNSLAGGHGLWLLKVKQNELPYVFNLFTPRVNMPEDYSDLRVAFRHTPDVFVLIRGSFVEDEIRGMTNDWKQLCVYEPLSEFKVDTSQPFINDSSIRPTADCPRFTTPGRYSFETFDELRYYQGLASLFEERFKSRENTYRGQAAFVPVPNSFHHGQGLHLAYTMICTLDKDSLSLPKLTDGDNVMVSIGKAKAAIWQGHVSIATAATGVGQVTIYINRPMSEGRSTDTTQYSPLTSKQVDKFSSPQIRQWVRDHKSTPVEIITAKQEKEMKRLMASLDQMIVPDELIQERAAKETSLAAMRELFLCKDHERHPRTGIWDCFDPKQLLPVKNVIYGQVLHDYQAAVVREWENNGVHASFAAVGGPSGVGKTFTALAALVPYAVLDVMQPQDHIDTNNLMRERYLSKTPASMDNATEDQSNVNGASQWEVQLAKGSSEAGSANQWKPQIAVPDKPTPSSQASKLVPEPGRLTLCAMQNETVDHLTLTCSDLIRVITHHGRIQPKLIIRVHSAQSELDLVLALIRPSFDYSPDDTPLPTLTSEDFLPSHVSESLRSGYIKSHRPGNFRYINDKRIRNVSGSMASYIIQLANVPGTTRSPEILATFTPQQLRAIEHQLRDIVAAYWELQENNDTPTEDIKKRVQDAARVGYRHLLGTAAVVITTLAVATEASFSIFRNSHAVMLEEAGRANCLDTMGLASHYPHAFVHMLVGCWLQLPPMAFGPSRSNPFQAQLHLSLLATLFASGFPVAGLQSTSRFGNNELLEICRLVNRKPHITMVGSAARIQLSDATRDIMGRIWQKKEVVTFINVEDSAPAAHNNSFLNVPMAITGLHHLERFLEYIEGEDVLYICAYNSQLDLVKSLATDLELRLREENKSVIANRLTKVWFLTVDSSMGRDRKHVIVDYSGQMGFFFEDPRTLVALTRAIISCVIIGDLETCVLSSKLRDNHAFRGVLKLIIEEHNGLVQVNKNTRRTWRQYREVLGSR